MHNVEQDDNNDMMTLTCPPKPPTDDLVPRNPAQLLLHDQGDRAAPAILLLLPEHPLNVDQEPHPFVHPDPAEVHLLAHPVHLERADQKPEHQEQKLQAQEQRQQPSFLPF